MRIADTNMLIYKKPHRSKANRCGLDAGPKTKQMEHSLCWVHDGLVCVGHADFMLFISFLFMLGFWWISGFKFSVSIFQFSLHIFRFLYIFTLAFVYF